MDPFNKKVFLIVDDQPANTNISRVRLVEDNRGKYAIQVYSEFYASWATVITFGRRQFNAASKAFDVLNTGHI